MGDFMEADTLPQIGVNDCLYQLPQRLQQENHLGVSVDLGDEE